MHPQKFPQLSIKIGFDGLIKETIKKTVITMFAKKKQSNVVDL